MTIEAAFNISLDNFTLKVDLEFPSQGITALFGPSGSGKSTLLRAIAGLEKHPEGRITLGKISWQDKDNFVPPHQRSIAYVFQEASLFEHLDVAGNLEYGLKRTPEAKRKISLEQAIDLLGIAHLLKRKTALLSGGERQRVAIARALATSPKLLLMDEPLASLDQKRKEEILPYIETLSKELNIPVLYVSHSPDEVARLADHLILLKAGKVLGTGPIREMLTRLDLPLAHRNDAEALLDATVVGHDDEYKLSYLEFAGGRFTVPVEGLLIGSKVRLRIAAQDVSLTLQQQTDTSILNIFPARVDEIIPEGSSQMLVRLTIEGMPILARVTRKSASLLELQPGKTLFAQVKSVAVFA